METEKDSAKQKNGWQRWIMIALLVVVVILLLLLLTRCEKPSEESARPAYETEIAARLGQLEGKSEAEIQAELDRVIGEGMFHISINPDPVFRSGDAEGNLEVENVPNNRYLMRVEITRNDTGELVYSTKYIEPDHHIQRAALDTPLAAGEYPATATFYAYDAETLEEIGSVGTVITLHILG